jgi:3-dehydroquinate synthase
MPVKIPVHSNIRDYEALIEETPDFIDTLAAYPQACFVIDENVWNIYAQTLLKNLPPEQTILLPVNEERKNLETVQELYDQLVERPAKRNLTLVSFGGGILQDLTGFAASTIYRGINWIYVPTTLLAQADSCIGSKTSLNYRNYKNLVGTFFPPTRIHIYTAFLQTQLEADFLSGLGEVIKLHLMGGDSLYRQLVEWSPDLLQRRPGPLLQAIQQSLQVKLSYLAGDEFDTGRRNLLNYGHDFGHALETTSNFGVPHGQAVIFGMLAANLISVRRHWMTEKLEQEIADSLLLPNLITRPSPEAMSAEALASAMKKDKKRTGAQLALIMMDGNFDFTRVNDLTVEEVAAVLELLAQRLAAPAR